MSQPEIGVPVPTLRGQKVAGGGDDDVTGVNQYETCKPQKAHARKRTNNSVTSIFLPTSSNYLSMSLWQKFPGRKKKLAS